MRLSEYTGKICVDFTKHILVRQALGGFKESDTLEDELNIWGLRQPAPTDRPTLLTRTAVVEAIDKKIRKLMSEEDSMVSFSKEIEDLKKTKLMFQKNMCVHDFPHENQM